MSQGKIARKEVKVYLLASAQSTEVLLGLGGAVTEAPSAGFFWHFDRKRPATRQKRPKTNGETLTCR